MTNLLRRLLARMLLWLTPPSAAPTSSPDSVELPSMPLPPPLRLSIVTYDDAQAAYPRVALTPSDRKQLTPCDCEQCQRLSTEIDAWNRAIDATPLVRLQPVVFPEVTQ
jgi:hypothetical protein